MSCEDDDRNMNDSTMPPPASRSSTTKQAAAISNITKIPRDKVKLRTGFGLTEWNRLTRVSKDLAQRRGQPLRHIKMEEIRQHNKIYDGWMVLRGKVYNIGPYLAYHPGGESILKKSLGTDATALFHKYHRWVNENNLIGKLLIGYLLEDEDDGSEDDQSGSYIPVMSNGGFPVPASMPPTKKLGDPRP